ncbi:MAG TPA: T9SS type A sorting domain-containing protein [Chitinophagaceae bacterium]
MRKIYFFLLAAFLFLFQNSNSQVSLTGATYNQDFNTLALSGTSSTVPAGWLFSESGTNANTIYTAGTGSGNAGDTYSFGAASNSERAFGGLQSGIITSRKMIVGESFKVAVLPNPSRTSFAFAIESNNELRLNIRIIDVQGRVIDRLDNVSVNSIINLGDKLKTGFYLAEIVQGEERKIVKLVKIP